MTLLVLSIPRATRANLFQSLTVYLLLEQSLAQEEEFPAMRLRCYQQFKVAPYWGFLYA